MEKSNSSGFKAPQLVRVVLLELNAKHIPSKVENGLRSRLTKNIRLELLASNDNSTNSRIRVAVETRGVWFEQDETKPIISLDASYEGRFIFREKIDEDLIEHWLDDSYYRDSLVAQVIPVVNTHLFAQLELMGVRTNKRALGYFSDHPLSQENDAPKPRRVRKKSLGK